MTDIIGETVTVPRYWPTNEMLEAGRRAHSRGPLQVYLDMIEVAARMAEDTGAQRVSMWDGDA
jgi:hypothetical protein